MSPYSLPLASKEKVGIEFVGRDWTALRVLCGGVSVSLASAKHLGICGTYYAKSVDWMISS